MTMPLSRRHFLQTAGAGAAVWVPAPVKGYSGAEMSAFAAQEGAGLTALGVSMWDLDTPALVVDLDALDANLETMQRTMERNGIASRPHAKTHKTPAIARLQLETGAVGICVAKVGEAEALFEHGIERLLMTTSNVTPLKIRRAMHLRKWCPTFVQATDTPENARDLSAAAEAVGVVADVVVDVDPGGHRTGVTPGEPALALAQLVDRLPGLRLRGILCYDGGSQHVTGFEARQAQTLERLAAAADTCERMRRSGLSTEIFSGGGTGTYNIDHQTPGFTDVQVGSYVFMDAQYLGIGGVDDAEVYSDFRPALTILTTVLNAQYDGARDHRRRCQGVHHQPALVHRQGRAGNELHLRLGRVRLHPLRRRRQPDVCRRRQAGADRVALRPGGEPLRPDVRGPQRHRRGGLGDRGARPLHVEATGAVQGRPVRSTAGAGSARQGSQGFRTQLPV